MDENLTGEIRIGPFVFEYDQSNREMFISKRGEHIATADPVWPEDWADFVKEARVDRFEHAGIPFH